MPHSGRFSSVSRKKGSARKNTVRKPTRRKNISVRGRKKGFGASFLRGFIFLALFAGLFFLAIWIVRHHGSDIVDDKGKVDDWVPSFPPKEKAVEKEEALEKVEDMYYADYDPYYYAKAFDFSWPRYVMDDVLIEDAHFTVCYDLSRKEPLWISGKLGDVSFQSKGVGRATFSFDSALAVRGVADQSAFLEGRLPLFSPLWLGEGAHGSALYLARNASVQYVSFHAQVWQPLCRFVWERAKKGSPLYVVVGKKKETFFCVLLDLSLSEPKGVGFLLPHSENNFKRLEDYMYSIQEVERDLDMEFFPRLPREVAKVVKASVEKEFWL